MRSVLVVFLLISLVGFSQRRYAADRYFKEFAYAKSAKLYEKIYHKGDTSKQVLSRLADSYYFKNNSKKAEKWYRLLFKNFKDSISSEYFFRYAQVLKSNGKVKDSDSWLQKLKLSKENDSRALALENNQDYFEDYSTNEKTFVNLKNLDINTRYSDFGGFIYKDQLYFASTRPKDDKSSKRRYQWNNQPFLNIYVANEEHYEMSPNLDTESFKQFIEVNTRYHESNVIFTSDGKTMYFTRDNYDGKKLKGDINKVAHLKIYRSDMINGEWQNMRSLPFNSDAFSCGHPALSTDEKNLYFVSDMPGGYGATDIYQVEIKDDGTYGKAKNLGRQINTEGREMFPFIDNENIMYFASDGHLGLGALDVFESKILNISYTKPKNLGTPINGPKDDFGFVISYDKSYGYFSSNRKGGKGDDDIYSFIINNHE
ncbi:PD40 domain-containing protein [Tenacibaculum sp. M341]|uniref:PD40 domain-containing protein n=1 Tax=Tenacibaculum sp. M341 TaxID=2530339 RepID=UPI001051359D|nr:PD40 domain-containing protein [Tenacibaculum sp. M341]TCI93176.1 hypothetical protein EYW44_06040 [Tenacibaculum sp. M341]